jgi:formylglycine-generating enzyme
MMLGAFSSVVHLKPALLTLTPDQKMKSTFRNTLVKAAILSMLPLATSALITSASAAIAMNWATIGHAGNPADSTTGLGAVAYDYKIGTYEVTNAQYTAFLNAVDPTGVNPNGIYSSLMGSNARGGITFTSGAAAGAKYTIRTDMGDKPVNFVSWYDAARFTNWLGNGQGSGSTETGAYTLSGNTGIIIKNVGATVWIPSEDEWYKAAYYDPTKDGTGGYWKYATQSDILPTVGSATSSGDISNPGANVANYNSGAVWNGQNGNVTTVGSAAANNYFGTADMNGNVWEWTDAVSNENRELRGGSFEFFGSGMLAGTRLTSAPTNELRDFGFRVATIPEPSSLLLTMLASGVMLIRRKR